MIAMALTGPPAKGNKHGRTPTADWTDVIDVPYTGPSPDLPRKQRNKRWSEQVVEWWEEVRRMPHCAKWTATDWRFALETAWMKEQFWADIADGELKSTLATEIRRREDQMGTTIEARRKLRIRYLDPAAAGSDTGGEGDDDGDPVVEHTDRAGGANVTPIESRRKRLSA